MLALYHLVWIGLLWLLHTRAARLTAGVALVLGAMPRAYFGLLQYVSAWHLDAYGWAYLIAFEALTVLWLIYLGGLAWGRPWLKLAYPMLIFSAVEFVAPAASIARSAFSVPVALQLLFCGAQFAYFRARVREAQPPPAQWSRL